ncbi:MAG: TIGR03618 family F420-dependent PPOX class oxidoreductase [Acidimicrobiales bacterium]
MPTIDPDSAALRDLVASRNLATLSTRRPDGALHVTPVGYTYDATERLVRIITFARAQKVRNLAEPGPAVVCEVAGGRWASFEGVASVTADPARCADAEARYAARYRSPRSRADRVVIELAVARILGRL